MKNEKEAAAGRNDLQELKEEFKNETPQRQLDLAIHSLRRNFTNIKVMYGPYNISRQYGYHAFGQRRTRALGDRGFAGTAFKTPGGFYRWRI